MAKRRGWQAGAWWQTSAWFRAVAVCLGVGAGWLGVTGYAAWRGPGPQMIADGQALFVHEWQPNDPLSGDGDGLGPVFNAKSCAECHFQGGVGGAGPNKHNVLTFEVHPNRRDPQVRAGVVHAHAIAPEFRESRQSVSEVFPIVKGGTRIINGCTVSIADFDPVTYQTVNTPPLFGLGEIDRIADGAIRRNVATRSVKLLGSELGLDFDGTPVGRPRVLPDGRIGKFGWKGQFATIEEFVAAACAMEMGLTNPLQAQQVAKRYTVDESATLDMTGEQFDSLVAFVGTLPRPVEAIDEAETGTIAHGRQVFASVGCADCHTPNLGTVVGIYSDLLLHPITDPEGDASYSRQEPEVPLPSDHPRPNEWKTPPLWGLADSAPYFHDGGSPTIEAAIERHAGSAKRVTARYRELKIEDREALLAFLRSLKAPAVPRVEEAEVASR